MLPTDNWYFMIASTFIIVIIGTLVTDKIVDRAWGAMAPKDSGELHQLTGLNAKESKALKAASWVLVALVVLLVVAAAVPGFSPSKQRNRKPYQRLAPHRRNCGDFSSNIFYPFGGLRAHVRHLQKRKRRLRAA